MICSVQQIENIHRIVNSMDKWKRGNQECLRLPKHKVTNDEKGLYFIIEGIDEKGDIKNHVLQPFSKFWIFLTKFPIQTEIRFFQNRKIYFLQYRNQPYGSNVHFINIRFRLHSLLSKNILKKISWNRVGRHYSKKKLHLMSVVSGWTNKQ